jgi:hypothetical protein
MGALSTYNGVARYASSHREPVQTVSAHLYARYAEDDLRTLFAQLTSAQQAIARAAYEGDLADLPSDVLPEDVTLKWVRKNYPYRKPSVW